MAQYAVDFGRTADRIQMEATKSTTLSAQGGGMGAKTGLYCLPLRGNRVEEDTEYAVRRLTPTEAERLQGLPDGFTDVEFNGKPALDSKRYKAIGNGMAHPCALFVLQQICKAEGITPPVRTQNTLDSSSQQEHYDVYSMGHDERAASFTANCADTLTASDYKQPTIVAVKG